MPIKAFTNVVVLTENFSKKEKKIYKNYICMYNMNY